MEVLRVMERRLYYAITWPAMLFTLVMGLALVYMNPEILVAGWFHAKIFFLVPLFSYHFFSGYTRKRFLKNDYFLSSRQCRMINEVPTLILIPVIFLAICKFF